MSNDPKSPKKIENIDIIDPLGEIRRTAKELWINDGEPEDKDWTDYFEKAEKLLVGGVGKETDQSE